MSAHRTGYSVARTITIAYMRDPRVMGIVAGTLYGFINQLGGDMSWAQAYAHAQDIRDGLCEADIVDGQQHVGGPLPGGDA